MIPRYEVSEISSIWTEDKKFSYFMQVEMALLNALEDTKMIPKVSDKFQKAGINLPRIHEIEATVHHDVIAFCSSITEQVEASAGKFFHYGCTSSDVIDTALSLQIRDSLEIEIKSLRELQDALWQKALGAKHLYTLGRSHGMFAEPMSFGFKFLSYVSEFSRRLEDLENFKNTLTGQMSGAVGNYTILTPEVEAKVLKALNLKVEPLSTQVIPRDRHATLAALQAGVADALERLAIEIRHLHRSDVNEVIEGFKPGQKGSSTMPHKKNPIASENISGLARVIRSHEIIARENTLLWHERDISHSSAERMWLPDSFGLTVYALRRAAKMIRDLHLNEEKITFRVQNEFATASSYILHKLLPTYNGTREELYAHIQAASFEAKSRDEFIKGLESRGLAIKSLPLHSVKDMYEAQTEAVFKRIKETYKLT
ncbi:adenylosuccinate lyase [Peredibacter sp. HCB2-198]|uniref:adenylosuccinate lyase n=1 Tax=Peredibacter sp. HCB2-198 TaxID=3383025 RepID=UPI0038B6009C